MSETPPWEDPRRVLARYGVKPRRRYSQNFLVDRGTVERIAEAATEGAKSVIVELGSGTGTLTTELLRRAPSVIAVDKDPQMRAILKAELGEASGLTIVDADASTYDFTAEAKRSALPVRATGNLPYALTGRILRNLIEHHQAIARAVVMVQREVRDRLLAGPGTKEYGALTVFVQAVFSVRTLLRLKPGVFFPAPKVESAVVVLEPLQQPRATIDADFEQVVRAAFQMRRKTLKNALAGAGTAQRVAHALTTAQIDGQRRGETLSIEEFASLARAWCDAAMEHR